MNTKVAPDDIHLHTFLSGMKETNYGKSVEIDEVSVVNLTDLKRLAHMLGICIDITNESYQLVKRRQGITKVVTKKIFAQNKFRFVDTLVNIIADRARSLATALMLGS